MINAATAAAVVAVSAIAFLVLLNALQKTIAASEWDSAALLGALSVVLFGLAYVVVTYSGAWDLVTEQYQDMELKPRWGNLLIMGVGAVLVAVCAAIFFLTLRRNKFRNIYNPAAVLALALAIISIVSTILNGDNPIRPAAGLMLAVLVACTVAPRGLGVHVGIGAFCVIAAIASGFAIVVHKDFSVMPCPWDKCGILGFQFRGIFHHENAFAIFLTLAMPFVYIGFASWEGPLLSAYLLGMVLLSGSRSSMAAAVLTFVVLILLRPNIRKAVSARKRTALLNLVLAVSFVSGFALPFVINDPGFLSERGHMWMLVKDALSDPATLIYGTGMLGWQHVVDAGRLHISMGYSAHNQWLHVLFTTGVIGLLLFVGLLAVLVWQAGRTYGLVVGCVLLPVFLLAVTERPWPIDSADWVLWIVPGALLSYPAVRRLSGDQTMDHPDVSDELISPLPVRGRHRTAKSSRFGWIRRPKPPRDNVSGLALKSGS
ncbi:O-antigen ligase [Mycobacterium sp. OAS707]|uniref:O-antigen ligase family protein n=1 Tax=Mycobacterium sp. OAS707 TaxID=2663822 RepID=UPI00178B4530|nr:O-antigen ligase family protein [Mycobacterium sp. OAS707]MBE1547972.1 O-antigen ligase [Mycobacterium sp. OAS707]